MRHGERSLLLGLCGCALLLSGCGSGSFSNISGSVASTGGSAGTAGTGPVSTSFSTGAAATGTQDLVLATASVAGPVSVVVGATQTLSITFTSDDGRLITGFGVSDTLGNLSPGWSGPATFSCAAVSTGSSCVLNLSYSPTATASGTLAVSYVFIDDSTQPKTGAVVQIPYAATANNNLAAMVSPTGQINAVIGQGAQSVNVGFTTDDGKAATNFTVTSDLGALPPGWTSSTNSLACAIVSTGNGCQLGLTYAPFGGGAGTLALNYAYLDDSGAPKTGSVNIPYAPTPANEVVATASPGGQIIAIDKTGGQAVAITFTTDDGKPASALAVTSDLTALPPGWKSAAPSFACGTVAAGNGCQLRLTYAPTALAGGTLALHYAYRDGSGSARTGLLNVAYTATTNDNVQATPSPSGQIAAVLTDGNQTGNGSQSVSLTFATDDGRPATALQVTSGLATLPPGWSTAADTFTCSGLDAEALCQLTLTYAPSAPGSGSLQLGYAYRNNAGESKSATASIPYRATVNDHVRGTPSSSSLPALRTGSAATTVTVAFATDDGNPASGLTVTSGLAALPAGWSGPAGLQCASVSAGTDCQLTLVYTPTVATPNGTVTLGFSYTNDAGIALTGTTSITYGAFTPYLYVVSSASTTLSACALAIDNSLAVCNATGSGFNGPSGIALNGSYAYVTNAGGNSVSRCTLDTGGALADCAAGGTFTAPTAIHIEPAGVSPNAWAYIQQSTGLTVCAIAAGDGTLSGCMPAAAAYEPLNGLALSTDGQHAYSEHANALEVCTVAALGTLNSCAATGGSVPQVQAALALANGALFASSSNGSLYSCAINGDASLGACQTTGQGTQANGFAVAAATLAGPTTAYVSTGSGIAVCPVIGGTLGTCGTVNDASFNGTTAVALRYP